MSTTLQWAVFIGIVTIEGSLLYKLITGPVIVNSAELIGAICVVGILLILTGNLYAIEAISLSGKGFRAELRELNQKTTEVKQAVADLILLSMGDEAYLNLTKLASGTFGPFTKEAHMGLETELYHRRNLGYVDLNKAAARSIHELPESGPELSEYVRITPKGRQYIELRERAMS